MLGPVLEAFWASGDWASAIRSVIGDQVPAGMVVVRVDAGGGLRADVGSPRTAIAGRTARIDVLVDSAMDADLELTVVLGAQTLIVEGAVRDDPGGRAPALVSPLRPLVGHRCQRRSLVPGGCAGEVGLPSPSVLPRSRRDPAGAGRATAGRLHPRHRVRPDGAGRPPGRGRDADGRMRPAATVRPGRRRLVRRRLARPHELQRRPGLHARRRGADAAWRGAPPGQLHGGQLPDLAGLRPGAARAVRRCRPAVVERRHGGADGRGIPQRPARPRARAGSERASEPLLRRSRAVRSPRGLATEQRRVPGAARAQRHGRLRPSRVHRVPGRVDRGIPAKPRDRSRRGSWSPTPRSAWSTPSTSSPRTTTRARCSSTTACCRAACGSPPRPARTSTCRSRTAPGWPPTRRAGAGSTPGSAISRCRCRPSSRPSAAGARWSPTGPG